MAIQLGVIGTLALQAMWIAHFLLFRSGGITAWLGTVIVIDNVVCSTFTRSCSISTTGGFMSSG
jgi:hypothetical protein